MNKHLEDHYRQTGRTTRAIITAPPNALYVVATAASVRYCEAIAKDSGRDDVQVVSASWFRRDRWQGAQPRPSVLDHHAARCMSDAQWRAYEEYMEYREYTLRCGGRSLEGS